MYYGWAFYGTKFHISLSLRHIIITEPAHTHTHTHMHWLATIIIIIAVVEAGGGIRFRAIYFQTSRSIHRFSLLFSPFEEGLPPIPTYLYTYIYPCFPPSQDRWPFARGRKIRRCRKLTATAAIRLFFASIFPHWIERRPAAAASAAASAGNRGRAEPQLGFRSFQVPSVGCFFIP